MDTRTHESPARDELGHLILSSRVEGTEVYNPQGEHLGTIEQVMIDALTGQVAYAVMSQVADAVMSFGGFIGIGEKYHPLPWQVLDYDTEKGGYVVDLDKKTLEAAPYYGSTDPESWPDRGWRSRVDEYYRPYF